MRDEPNHPDVLTPASFAGCFRRASPALWCIAAAVLGERTHAEDVLQEAAMIGLAKLGTFTPGTSFAAWLGQIVRFTALNHRRKLARRADGEAAGGEAVLADAAPPTADADLDPRILAALEGLGATARACLLLKVVIELDYAEIAETLGIPQGTAMSHVHRARARLRSELRSPDDDPTTPERAP
jgi:RNA polymerase sigma-70 factor, ECF subfamily